MVHKFRARKFYNLMNEIKENSVTICFDLMQNQELPKSSITEAYYSRQLWQYFLGIVIHKGIKSSQSHNEVFFYTWGEYQEGRGPNVIGSALYDFLDKYVTQTNTQIKTIKLVSDSCGGQNKNYALVSMVNSFALKHNLTIEWMFPIRGHSYMPPDRAFGRVEKMLNKVESINEPKEYFKIFSNVGQIREIGIDWNVYDLKTYAQNILKPKKPFNISDAKMIRIEPKKTIEIKNNYSGLYESYSILKRGKRFSLSNLVKLSLKTHVKPVKLFDIKKLIDKIGINEDHEAFEFYRKVENASAFGTIDSDTEDNE
jgi:hypothetical protein